MKYNQLSLYLDVDDTITNSSEVIINLLNKKHNIQPPKTIYNLKDYGYKSIYKNINRQEIEQLYESDEFFEQLQINKQFLNTIQNNIYKFKFVSKGTDVNLEKKFNYLENHFPYSFTFRGIQISKEKTETKRIVDMNNGIQIDDLYENLIGTNAALKILITNGGMKEWNKHYGPIDNLYIAKNWDEIKQILEFVYQNPNLYGIL